MNLKISFLAFALIGFTFAEPPPPNYMFNNYDHDGKDFFSSDGDDFGSAFSGSSQNSQGSGGGDHHHENDVGHQETQSDDFGYDGSPHNTYEGPSHGGGGGDHSYSPPSFDSFGPSFPGPPKKKQGMRIMGFLPKIRINIKRRPSKVHASPSHFSYPTYASGHGHSSSSSSFSGFPSSHGGFSGSHGGSSHGGSSGSSSSFSSPETYNGFVGNSNSFGGGSQQGGEEHKGYDSPSTYAPSKGYSSSSKQQSYDSPNSYGPPSKGHKSSPPKGKQSSYNAPINQYGGDSDGFDGSYNSPSSQYGHGGGSSGGGGYKSGQHGGPGLSSQTGGYGYNSPPIKASPQGYGGPSHSPKGYAGTAGSHSMPNMQEYVRGPSYTKYGPPIKGHTQSSQPISMGPYGAGFGDDDSSSHVKPLAYGSPNPSGHSANAYNVPPKSQSSYNGPDPNSYNNNYDLGGFNDNEDRYKRRPSESNSARQKSPPRGGRDGNKGGYPGKSFAPSSQGSFGRYMADEGLYNNFNSFENFDNNNNNNNNQHNNYQSQRPNNGPSLYGSPSTNNDYAEEDLAGY